MKRIKITIMRKIRTQFAALPGALHPNLNPDLDLDLDPDPEFRGVPIHAVADRLLTCPLVPFDILNARTSSRLPPVAFWPTTRGVATQSGSRWEQVTLGAGDAALGAGDAVY